MNRLLPALFVTFILVTFAGAAHAMPLRVQALGGLGIGTTSTDNFSETGFGGGLRLTGGFDVIPRLTLGAYFSHVRSGIDSLGEPGAELNRSLRQSGVGLHASADVPLVRLDVHVGYAFGSFAFTDGGLSSASVNSGVSGFQFGVFLPYEVKFTRKFSLHVGPFAQFGFLSTDEDSFSELTGLPQGDSFSHQMYMLAVQVSYGG